MRKFKFQLQSNAKQVKNITSKPFKLALNHAGTPEGTGAKMITFPKIKLSPKTVKASRYSSTPVMKIKATYNEDLEDVVNVQD